MKQTQSQVKERQRHLMILGDSRHWPTWPFLALVRRPPGQEEEYGVLYDALKAKGWPGYSATVLLTNLFMLPPLVAQFLTLPREVYDTPDEIFAAGWRVD